jgi:hypothetical protein
LAPNFYSEGSGYYGAGDIISASVSVTGGVSDNCVYYLMDTVNFNIWKGSGGGKPVLGANDLGNFSGTYKVPTAGRYHHIIFNPNSNLSKRTFNISRTVGVDEAADDQLGAIFNALKKKNIVYTNVLTDYFVGAQNVKTPAESLASGSANCIDGTLVFASALEAIGMETYLVFTKGHAYVAVGWYPTAENEHWTFLETTMVGGVATFDQAKAVGLKTFQFDKLEGNIEETVSIKEARNAGIVPGGY